MNKVYTKHQLARANKKYEKWKRDNPCSEYGEYYVQNVISKLDSGQIHNTLGEQPKDNSKQNKIAHNWFKLMKNLGLSPSDKVIDYGCGSLCKTKPFLDYLNNGSYLGLDLTDQFYSLGLKKFSPSYINQKRPEFKIINDDNLVNARKFRPNWVFSHSVLLHVPPGEVELYFQKLLSIFSVETLGLIQFREDDFIHQHAPKGWSYDKNSLSKIINSLGFELINSDNNLLPQKNHLLISSIKK